MIILSMNIIIWNLFVSFSLPRSQCYSHIRISKSFHDFYHHFQKMITCEIKICNGTNFPLLILGLKWWLRKMSTNFMREDGYFESKLLCNLLHVLSYRWSWALLGIFRTEVHEARTYGSAGQRQETPTIMWIMYFSVFLSLVRRP